MAKMQSRSEISAGGVVVRQTEGGAEVLICKAAGYGKWVLPKGQIDPGETPEQTALREVREETGVQARLIAPLGEPEKYIYSRGGMRIFKQVHYYLMAYESGSVSDHDHEMTDVRWMPFDEAYAMLGYAGAKSVLLRAKELLGTSG